MVLGAARRDEHLAWPPRRGDRLLGVHDGVEEHLLELLGVTDDSRRAVIDHDHRLHASLAQRALVQCDHPVGYVLQVHGLAHARPLPREVEQRLNHAPRAHRLQMDDVGTFALIGRGRVDLEHLGERGDRGERVVELVRHARNERPQLGQAVRLQQLALQQHLPRHVDGEEQQLGGPVATFQVLDHRLHFARRFPAHFDCQARALCLGDGVAQHDGERRALGLGRPVGQRAPAQGPGVRHAQQLATRRIRFEDLSVRGHDEGGDRHGAEQLSIQPALHFGSGEQLACARVHGRLVAQMPQQQHQVVPRTPRHPGLEDATRELGNGRRGEVCTGLAVEQHFVQRALDVRPPGTGEGGPEVAPQHLVGAQSGDPGGGRAPFDDRPIGRDRRHSHVEAVDNRPRLHTPRFAQGHINGPVGRFAGATGPNVLRRTNCRRILTTYCYNWRFQRQEGDGRGSG